MIACPDAVAPAASLTSRGSARAAMLAAGALVAALLLPVPSGAQSFDCAKAQSPVDRAICASPQLRQLDSDLAKAYAAALARDPGQADAVRQAQRSWGQGRAACVAAAAAPAGRAASAEACLAASYAARLAALAQPPSHTAAAPASPPSAGARAAATPSPAATPPSPAAAANGPVATAAGIPPVATAAAVPPASTTPIPPPAAAGQNFAAARPATGLPAIPPGAASLERDRFPTAGETDTFLRVTSPGRFAIRAESATGTALQLVDMLTGPGDRTGWPGKADGRIDALLDTGTYKLRAFGDPAATGETHLTVTAFTDAAPAQLAPGYQPVAATLRDLQQASFWLVVADADTPTRIEAAGRSLAALNLWRDGRDLVALPEHQRDIALTPAHPLAGIVLAGKLPPGTYLVTAYGGPPLPWSDGAADQPLYLRTGRSTDLLAGGATGQVGVFGSEVFHTPPDAAHVLLSLPQPAEAHLRAAVPGAEPVTADLAKTDKARATLLDLPGKPDQDRVVSLQAAPGQAFTLRPMAAAGVLPDGPGRYWLGIAEPANGGDEAPAAAILTRARRGANGTLETSRDILASPGVPDVGPGKAWRTRFNLRGPTTLLFHATAAVTVAVHADGPPITPRITTLDGAVLNAQGDGRTATSWALSPGWYGLALSTRPDGFGILDLTLGPPGVIPPAPEPAGPEAPVLPLGEQAFASDQRLSLLANRVPDGRTTQLVRAVPVELADGPLVQTLAPGETARIALHARDPGILVLRDVAGGAPLESQAVAANIATSVTLPAADHARTLAVAVLPAPPSATPAPASPQDLAALTENQPVFLDLARGAGASFALTVGQGGLYRVETTGRLKTAGRIGTSFIPVLGRAAANGVGSNMLLQRYLRAGRYRLDISAQDSAGRLGVEASATPLAEGAELLPGLSVRATLSPGSGIAFPIRIAAAGRYHLDLLGVEGRKIAARLEDADGWPLRAAGELSALDQDFAPGNYRLIVQPPSVPARAVARLRRIEPPVALTGHGPHTLPFDAAQSLQWREPPGRDDRRTPDTWTFSLAGPAKVTLRLDGDGMAASLLPAAAGAGAASGSAALPTATPDGAAATPAAAAPDGSATTPATAAPGAAAIPGSAAAAASDAPPLGRVLAGTPLTLDLPAGDFRVVASALGRNDRLDYAVTLHSAELQPDTPRRVALPAELPFAVATARVVTLTSFGRVPLRAELRTEAGDVVARAAGRTDDWNIALSRFLPAGRYRLALAPLVPPAAASDAGDTSSDNASNDNTSADNGAARDNQPDSDNGSASDSGSSGDNAADNDSGSDSGAMQAADSAGNDATPGADSAGNDSGNATDAAADRSAGGDSSQDMPGTDAAATAGSGQDAAGNDNANQPDSAHPPPRTQITLFLPTDQPEVALPADDAVQLQAGGIQHVTLPPPAAGSLLVAAAEAPVELILALERRAADGTWHTVGQSQGLAPLLAVPAGADGTTAAAAAWRASVWTVDGGTVPIRLAARAVTATPAAIGSVALAPVALVGITRHWHAALVADPGAAMLRLAGPDAGTGTPAGTGAAAGTGTPAGAGSAAAPRENSGLLAATSPGQPAAPPPGGMIVAQSDAVWLLSPGAGPANLAVVPAGPGSALALGIPTAGRATLPLDPPADGKLCAAIAASGLGQPGLQAGRGMGVAPGSTFALCGGATLTAWNAGGGDELRLRLRREELTLLPAVAADQLYAGTVPPHTALPLHWPAGMKRLDASLAAGGALVAGWQQPDAVTAWAADTALSRSLTGAWTDVLLVNTGDDPAPVALSATAAAGPQELAPGKIFRRFFGAGGSFVLNLTAQPGQRLVLAGDAAASVQRPDGQVRSGRAIALDGLATAVVTHAAGPLALWIEGPGVSPWPAAKPADVTLPQRVTLAGEAMALHLSPGAPVLLRLASTAPVILSIGSDPPAVFRNGAALARYLPAGDATLQLLAPQDGPLSGSLELAGSPVTEVAEGLGAPVAIPPGGAAVFGFTVTAAGPVGLGVRADPDRVAVRLLDDHGATLAQGVSMLRQLTPGHYLLEASVPPDAPTTLARPAVLGIVPHRNRPPPEVVRGLLLAAGFAPPDTAR